MSPVLMSLYRDHGWSCRVRILLLWLAAAKRRALLRRCHDALSARDAELTQRSLLARWRAGCALQRGKAAKLYRAVLQMCYFTTARAFRHWSDRCPRPFTSCQILLHCADVSGNQVGPPI